MRSFLREALCVCCVLCVLVSVYVCVSVAGNRPGTRGSSYLEASSCACECESEREKRERDEEEGQTKHSQWYVSVMMCVRVNSICENGSEGSACLCVECVCVSSAYRL
jgi:hypothetical protein